MKRYVSRPYIVEFPDDGGATLDAVMELTRRNDGTSLWLGDWLLRFTDIRSAVYFRCAFPDLRITPDKLFVVSDFHRAELETWLSETVIWGELEWRYLEVVTPWSREAAQDWAAAYRNICGRGPRLRNGERWAQRLKPKI